VLARRRAFPEGGTRDYRGERFVARPAMPASAKEALATPTPPPATGQPRLVVDGVDATPATEPEPTLAIDRLVRVRVRAGERAAARVTLRGDCVGTMADLAGKRSCEEDEGVLVPVAERALDGDLSIPSTSAAGTFDPKGDCASPPREGGLAPDGTRLFDDQVCVPGAMFRFGTPDGVLTDHPSLPERVVVVDPFLVDRYELSVARYRAALAAGFVSPDDTPVGWDGDLPATPPIPDQAQQCTWSDKPRGREAYPLNCISHAAGRALCRFLGGDLPGEAQWEYAAAIAGRDGRTRFPWGGADDARPTCARAIWGRSGERGDTTNVCRPNYGPAPLDASAGAGGDVTPGLGIVGLGGSLGEHTRDALAEFTAPCWTAAPLRNPSCDVTSDTHTTRGGVWFDDEGGLVIGVRRELTLAGNGFGLRCVYPAGESK
jgi:formylglycine-generating enzyme required for sulfatase activity